MQENEETKGVGTKNCKKVVEEIGVWMRIYDDGSVDRTFTGAGELKPMIEPVPPHENFVEGVATRDLTVDSLRIRIYLPEAEGDKLPIILQFHGGGFCITHPDYPLYYHFYSRLSRATRAIIVSPFLRLAPEHRLPAAFDDGVSALQWLASLARGDPWVGRHGDLGRVFLLGESAGGNVVHQVAVRARGLDLRVAGAVLMDPGFVREEWGSSKTAHRPVITEETLDKFFKLALPVGATKGHPYTCPMNAAEEAEVGPMLVCVSGEDVMRETQLEYCHHMRKWNQVELLLSPGMGHCFYFNNFAHPDLTANLITHITHFINNH